MARLNVFFKSIVSFISYPKKRTNNPIKYFKNCFKRRHRKQKLQKKFKEVIAFWTPS